MRELKRDIGVRTGQGSRPRARLMAVIGAVIALLFSVVAVSPAQAWVVKPVGQSTSGPWRCAPPSANYEIRPVAGLPAAWLTSLTAAAKAWTDAGTPVKLTVGATLPTSSVNPADLTASTTTILAQQSAAAPSNTDPNAYASAGRVACNVGKSADVYSLLIFTAKFPSTAPDQTAILVHELTHVLGLSHPPTQPCVSAVYARFAVGDCRDQGPGPYADDIAGVLSVFAPNQTPGFPANSAISSGANSLTVSTTAGIGSYTTFEDTDSDDSFRWTFVPQRNPDGSATGWGRIVNTQKGLCLEGTIGSYTRLGRCDVVPYTRTATLWRMSATSGTIQLSNKLAADYDGADACLGTEHTFLGDYGYMVACGDATSNLKIGAPVSSNKDEFKRFAPDNGNLLIGQGSSRCVEAPLYGHVLPSAVQLSECNTYTTQSWKYDPQSGRLALGYTTALPVVNGDAVDYVNSDPLACLSESSPNEAAAARIVPCNQTETPLPTAAQWTALPNGQFVNRESGKCLDAYGGGTAAGTALIVYTCSTNNATNQIFNQPARAADPLISLASAAPDRNGALLTGNGSAVLPSGELEAQTRLPFEADAARQQWSYIALPHQSKGALINHASGKCLDARAQTSNVSNLTVRACSSVDGPLQTWELIVNADGTLTFKTTVSGSAQCLEVNDGGTSRLAACTNAANQHWRNLVPADTASTSTPSDVHRALD